MQKCLPLNLLKPTKAKERLLRESYASFFSIVKEAFGFLDGVKSRAQLHRLKRLQQHLKDGWRLTSIVMKQNLRFLAVLSKDFPEPDIRPNWMGMDINSSKIAVSIIDEDKVLKQTYYGKDVSTRQFRFEERRALLQEYRDTVSELQAHGFIRWVTDFVFISGYGQISS